jgi:hypothetical protein
MPHWRHGQTHFLQIHQDSKRFCAAAMASESGASGKRLLNDPDATAP